MMKIPLSKPYLGSDELSAVQQVLESGWLAHGPKTKEFEEAFARYIGTKHAVSVNSCASALHAAIVSHHLKGEILVPSFTFPASANTIITAGCRPVFVDVNYDTCNIDPTKIEAKISSKTTGIMPVHYAGQSCDMDPILEIAEKHNLTIIEDSAETIGGTYGGIKSGAFGTGCFSFYPTKNLTTGEGGMVTTGDDSIAETIRLIKGHGVTTTTHERERLTKPWIKEVLLPGYNFRMCDINAAIGVVQLAKLDSMNDLRRKAAHYLSKRLTDIKGIQVPVEHPKAHHVYQMYPIKVQGMDRDQFISRLRNQGIGAIVAFEPAVHEYKYYRTGFDTRDLSVTERLTRELVVLPMYPGLTRPELDYMVEHIEIAAQAV
jgi:perosamine synthetase